MTLLDLISQVTKNVPLIEYLKNFKELNSLILIYSEGAYIGVGAITVDEDKDIILSSEFDKP